MEAQPVGDDLEAAVDAAITTCDGNMGGAGALSVTVLQLEPG
jgi:hypothetical protein